MALTRRKLLEGFLGAAAATGSCRKRSRGPRGSIRGASAELGHELRKMQLEPASGAPRTVQVAIVGGGVSGLCAAWRLERLGISDFVLFDLEAEAGGTAAFGTDGVVPYPWGAHYVPMPADDNPALSELLLEVGALDRDRYGKLVAKETTLIREPEERIFVDGAWHPGLFPNVLAGPPDLAELERFEQEIARWVEFRDAQGRRAFTLPVRHCSEDTRVVELDRMSAHAWLESRGFQSELLRWYVEYACRDDYGLDLEHTSAWAMLFYFASRVPAAGRESAPLLTWPEGNGRLVRHLSRVAEGRVHTRHLVTEVAPSTELVELDVYDARTEQRLRYRAEHVILATPRFVTARILRPFRERPPEGSESFSYGSWLVANLHLRGRPERVGFGPAWDNVLYDSPGLGYVVATHQDHADFGPTIWTYYRPYTDTDPRRSREQLLSQSYGELAGAVLADLSSAHEDLSDKLERLDVWRWGHAMIRPTPGFVWSRARRSAATSLGRVHFCHSDLSGVALFEEAQDHGVRAAETVARALGRRFTGWVLG